MAQKNSSHIVSTKINVLIWLSLVALTGITVMVARADTGTFGVLINILIASAKAVLVVYIFMHMKYESAFLKLMLLATLITMTLIIMLTFLDILYR